MMGEIRTPVPSEFPRVVEMGRNFHASLPQVAHIPYSDESAYRWIDRMMNEGFLLVALEDGKIVGGAGALFAPFIFNDAYTVGQELFWWVEPEYRGGGLGAEMLREMERRAYDIADIWSMIAMHDTGVGKLYERAGYEPGEKIYFKRFD